MSTAVEPSQNAPPEIEVRLKEWRRFFKLANRGYYFIGVGGVVASAAAASQFFYPQILSLFASLCIATIGFAQPQKAYQKYVRAWRILDTAAIRFRYGIIDLAALFIALEQAERVIAESESKESDQWQHKP